MDYRLHILIVTLLSFFFIYFYSFRCQRISKETIELLKFIKRFLGPNVKLFFCVPSSHFHLVSYTPPTKVLRSVKNKDNKSVSKYSTNFHLDNTVLEQLARKSSETRPIFLVGAFYLVKKHLQVFSQIGKTMKKLQ